jgi:hypothetical protein
LNDPTAVARAKLALGNGLGINRVAKLAGLSNGTVARIKMEMAGPRSSVQLPTFEWLEG